MGALCEFPGFGEPAMGSAAVPGRHLSQWMCTLDSVAAQPLLLTPSVSKEGAGPLS